MPSFKILITLLSIFIFITECYKQSESTTLSQDKKENPISLKMKDSVVIDIYNDEFLYMKLKTTYLAQRTKPAQLFIKPVFIKILNKKSEIEAWIESDSGATNETYSQMTLWGSVKAYTPQKEKIYTDSLVWNETENKITTDAKLKIISKDGDIITGKGFMSDKEFKEWVILNNVRTQIKNLEDLE